MLLCPFFAHIALSTLFCVDTYVTNFSMCVAGAMAGTLLCWYPPLLVSSSAGILLTLLTYSSLMC